MSKNILKSKTFWLNLVGAAQLLSGALPLDPATTGYILTAANVVNRVFGTSGEVTVLPQEKNY
jgi:hypothetical protein